MIQAHKMPAAGSIHESISCFNVCHMLHSHFRIPTRSAIAFIILIWCWARSTFTITTVDVFGQPAAGWSIIGMLNLITKFLDNAVSTCDPCLRVGIQCWVPGVSSHTKIFIRCASSWTSPESCHLKCFDF